MSLDENAVYFQHYIGVLQYLCNQLLYFPFAVQATKTSAFYHIPVKISTTKTKLAGILNVTPDSFSDGGKYIEPVNAQKRLMQMIEEGADIIDIGAESTRPGSKPVNVKDEILKIKKFLKIAHKKIKVIIFAP